MAWRSNTTFSFKTWKLSIGFQCVTGMSLDGELCFCAINNIGSLHQSIWSLSSLVNYTCMITRVKETERGTVKGGCAVPLIALQALIMFNSEKTCLIHHVNSLDKRPFCDTDSFQIEYKWKFFFFHMWHHKVCFFRQLLILVMFNA